MCLFFKQNAAYELRISDWSSACALPISAARNPALVIAELTAGIADCDPALIAVFVSSNLPYEDIVAPLSAAYRGVPLVGCTTAGSLTCESYEADGSIAIAFDRAAFSFETCLLTALRSRSEEHTSELQSLMRISYAVFR